MLHDTIGHISGKEIDMDILLDKIESLENTVIQQQKEFEVILNYSVK